MENSIINRDNGARINRAMKQRQTDKFRNDILKFKGDAPLYRRGA
jgi:hypothetical protein